LKIKLELPRNKESKELPCKRKRRATEMRTSPMPRNGLPKPRSNYLTKKKNLSSTNSNLTSRSNWPSPLMMNN
jgi:hypothetical protein